MKVQSYLDDLIFHPKSHTLSLDDLKMIKFEGIEQYIFKKLSSTKYRSTKIPDQLREKVIVKINHCITNDLPIHISVPFGGYKKWQFPSHPEIDWAEVFNILFLIEWLMPVVAGYEKGVILEYFSDEIFISRMNNIPQEDLDLYNDQFREALKIVQKTLPENFILKLSKIRDQISQKEILKHFDKAIIQLRRNWDDLPKEIRDERIAKSQRNYKMDFDGVDLEEKERILLDSTLIHDAFIFSDEWEQNVPWAFDIDMIPIGFRYTRAWGVHLKSSWSSNVQFWVGTGVLVQKEESLLPTILTYNQYLNVKNKLVSTKIDLLPSTFTNLQEISILNGKQDKLNY